MPIPTLTGLPPKPEFKDITSKLNKAIGELNNLLLNLDSLNVVSLTADHIDAGTIDANIVTIRSDLTEGAYIQIDGNGLVINNGSIDTLVADINGEITATGITLRNDLFGGAYTQIDNTGIVINNGAFDTFRADVAGKVTMTGALIRSASGYPAIVMDPDDELFGAYASASEAIQIGALDDVESSPYINFINDDVLATLMLNPDGLSIQVSEHIYFTAPDGLFDIQEVGQFVVANWSQILNADSGQTLQQALDLKADAGAVTDGSGGHNHGIAPGTQLATAGGGFVTWVDAEDHVHTQN